MTMPNDKQSRAELVERLREAGYTIGTLEAELQVLRADAANPDKGMWTFWNDKARQLATDKAALEAENARLREVVESMFCPRPADHRPDEFDVKDCVAAGECGCSAAILARSALNPDRSEK